MKKKVNHCVTMTGPQHTDPVQLNLYDFNRPELWCELVLPLSNFLEII